LRGFWLEIVAHVIDTSRALRSTNEAICDSRISFKGPHPMRGYCGAAAAVFRPFHEDDRDDDDDDDEEKALGGAAIIVKGLTTDAIAILFLSSVSDSRRPLRISDVTRLLSHVTSLNFYASYTHRS